MSAAGQRLAPVLALLALGAACQREPASGTGPARSQPGWFTDITGASGVRFKHVAGTNYFMPDQVGGGIALFDFNNDGLLDLYLVQNGGAGSPARNQLFQQQTGGTFTNVSEGSGLDVAGRGMGAIAGDVNNDGLADIVVTEYGATRLFQNLGGRRFREVTAECGMDNPLWAAPASFIDYDRDGRLDLVVGNYVDYDPTQVCHDVHGQRDFCAPGAFAPTPARLWRNVTPSPGAAPRFEERTALAGLASTPGVALGLICADFDGDGWPDIFCSDDGRPNRLFINRQNGTFAEQAAIRGLAFNAMGQTAANMGTAFADVDGDGLADLFVTHLSEEFHALYRQDRRGFFTDVISVSGLQQQAWRGTGFGTVLADFDLDGAPDLAFVNGLVRRAVPGQSPVAPGVDPWWGRYAQRSQLFANDGRGKFRDVSLQNSVFCGEAMVGRSLAAGDLDNDGAMDLVVQNVAGPLKIFRNTAPRRGNWARLRLILPQHGGREAIGAEVVLRAGGRSFWAVLQPASSYLVSHDPVLHFGLGSAEKIESVEVRWPDGARETFSGVQANQLSVLKQGSGS